jgi:hypothetical protein
MPAGQRGHYLVDPSMSLEIVGTVEGLFIFVVFEDQNFRCEIDTSRGCPRGKNKDSGIVNKGL